MYVYTYVYIYINMFECDTLPYCEHHRQCMIIIVAISVLVLTDYDNLFANRSYGQRHHEYILDKEPTMVAQPVSDHGPAVLTQEAPMEGNNLPRPNIGDTRSWDQQQPELHDAVEQ